MKLCRFEPDRVGIVRDGLVYDVTDVTKLLPALHWPVPRGDLFIANFARLRPEMERIAAGSKGVPLDSVKMLSPVANPGKIIAAPINYNDHIAEAKSDQTIAHGRDFKTIGDTGMLLKATSSLVGPSEGVAQRFVDRRNDHEIELAVVIGKQGTNVPKAKAMDYVLGYSIGLDMTVRGPELPCFRKSIDSYSVLGPWMVTADEVPDPGNLDLKLSVNGQVKQNSNTRYLVFDVPRLIEFTTSFYTVYPGDVIMTGTPAGVGGGRPPPPQGGGVEE
ncbi:MAG: fumarylacetoacetate hydrolase family protein [Rhodospirillaceae bacterium]|nr:fumarylacetoacetate hydrolase family protein [Rhodospirillaceae bacterium]